MLTSCQKLRDELKAIRAGLEEVMVLLSVEAVTKESNDCLTREQGQTRGDFFDQITRPDELPEDEDLFCKVIMLITDMGYASTMVLQHRLEINYRQATGIITELQRAGLIAPAHGFRPHTVLPAAYSIRQRIQEEAQSSSEPEGEIESQEAAV
jgi:DNA segregation ATPase FtsK/SpoIIIE-like protein